MYPPPRHQAEHVTALSVPGLRLFIPASPSVLATTDPFMVSTLAPFPECHVVGTIQNAAFPDWPLSFIDIFVFF